MEKNTAPPEAPEAAQTPPGDSGKADEALQVPLADEPVVIPPNLKLRLEKCPKCQYERQAGDDAFASPFECPKCGVVYALAMEEVRRKGRGHELQAEAEAEELRRLAQVQDENIRSSQIGSAMFVGQERSRFWLVLLVLALLALGAFLFI